MAKTTLPWITVEEITLFTAWCNAMDTYVTRDIHSRKGFSEEVFANFEKDTGGTIRGYDVIVSKWKNLIRPKVVAFSVVYDGVQRMDENGSSDLVLFQNTLAEYQTRLPTMAKTTLPWITVEEITLFTAWCNAMDTYVTRDIHSRKGFSEEVFANFEKDTGGTIRGYDVIVSKWKNLIRPKVVAFSVVYDGVQRMDENGSSDLVLFQNTLAEYQTR
ncbi:hypothetical protein Tco_0115884 [Tanacetum coccineum]